MKKWIVFLAVIALTVGMLAGCGSKEPEVSLVGDMEYGWSANNRAPYGDGMLLKDSKVYVFDGDSEQMVPLCSRPECSHMTLECPAVYLAENADAVVLYEGRIWYVDQAGEQWVFGSADLNGENQKQEQTVEMGTWSLGVEHLFYQGNYYTVAANMELVEETGEVLLTNAVVQIDLATGEAVQLTEPVDISANMFLAGACGDFLYYTAVVAAADGSLARNIYERDLNAGTVETIAQSGFCKMAGAWMAYRQTNEAGMWEVALRNVETDEIRVLDEMAAGDLAQLSVSDGAVFWIAVGASGVEFYFYDIETEKATVLTDMGAEYLEWSHVGDGWLTWASDPTGAGAYAYYYISEKDLAAGEELTKVN